MNGMISSVAHAIRDNPAPYSGELLCAALDYFVEKRWGISHPGLALIKAEILRRTMAYDTANRRVLTSDETIRACEAMRSYWVRVSATNQ